ncbi:MAG: xylulokinase [Candidatus Sumerlaeia bacterium]
MSYLLGIDLGTSETKTILMREDGEIVAQAGREYPLSAPHPGWSEQDPEDWWKAACETTREVIEKSGVSPEEIKGIGYSGQMHGSVFLDEKGKVIRPCILWNDSRTWKECEEVTEKIGLDNLQKWIANPVMTGFTLPKVVWLQKNEPENAKRVSTVMLPKDYLRYKMTGDIATDISDAAGTAMFNVAERRWSSELLKALDIPEEWMPPVKASFEVTGTVTKEAADATGLHAGTPVVGGGADNPCGAIGAGVVVEGRLFASLGTSGVLFSPMASVRSDPDMRLHNFCAAPAEQWYLMGVVLSAGMCLRWYRDKYAFRETAQAEKEGRDPYDIMMEKAAQIPVGSEGLFFLPYIMGERTPINDPHARGAFVGLSFRHNPDHMIRAIVEGVSFALRDNMEVVRSMNVKVDEVRLIGGGAKSPFWRQLMADILGAEVVTLKGGGGPGLGAAILAGVGSGVYPDLTDAVDQLVPTDLRIEPNAENQRRYNDIYGLYHALYPALKQHYRLSHALLE